MAQYLLTIRKDESSTYDCSVEARNAYHAHWLGRHLVSKARIIAIRPAQKPPGGCALQPDLEHPPSPL